jgi:general secretion pathway protein I
MTALARSSGSSDQPVGADALVSGSRDPWNRYALGSRSVRLQVQVLGFTLIEVLAALVIVSLGMLGVITAVGQTASNSTYLRDKTIAHWVAMNRLTEVRLQPQAPKVDKSSDEVEMAGQRWRWTMNVTQTEVESIRRIDVSVRPAEADEDSSMAFITGFYGAALAPAGSTIIMWQGAERPGAPGPQDRDGSGQPRDRQDPQLPPTPEPEPSEPDPPPAPEPSE